MSGGAPAALAFALLLGAAAPAAGAIPLAEYRDRLAGIEASLRAGDWVGAKLAARRLLAERIAWRGEELAPDASVLEPIAGAASERDAGEAARRVAILAAGLSARLGEREEPVTEDAAAARSRLARARAREALAALPEGGEVPQPGRLPQGPLAALAEFLRPLRDAVRDLIESLKEWLRRLFARDEEGSGAGIARLATGLAIAIAAGVVALGVAALRRAGRAAPAAPAAAAEPLRPAADADPLSREAGEWERYARELAAAGRAREAVRAWYHAVLVALYRAGRLHYRKGRTNWEYVAMLPPALAWRPDFAEMTRHFEREWYGRDESEPEAADDAAALAARLLTAARRAA